MNQIFKVMELCSNIQKEANKLNCRGKRTISVYQVKLWKQLLFLRQDQRQAMHFVN